MKSYTSLGAIRQDIEAGNLTLAELTEAYLQRIEEKAHLNAFLEVYVDEARQHAAEVDQKIKAGTAGRLAGMVVGIKDVLCHKDHGLQSASKILDGFKSQFTATAVQRLLDEDAVIIGRQNCDEFAMGSSNENSAFGPVLNDADNERVPGGSSGGSAVAVQADLCLASLGTDTGGSVRQPASFTGIYGLKPTYSRISRYGLAAYASSFDCIGILAQSIEDTALLLEIMSGSDEFDSTVSQQEVPAYTSSLSQEGKVKVAYLKESFSESVQKEIREATESVLNNLKGKGHEVSEASFDLLDYALPTYYILTTAEASSNLSRYDGVRYGHRSDEATDLLSVYKKSRSEGFGPEVKKRIMLGTFALSKGHYDAYYTKAQQVRRLIKEEIDRLLEENDFLVLPTSPTTAFKFGQFEGDSIAMYLSDVFTVSFSLAGVPAISVPVGKDERGLPIGLQIVSKSFGEAELLAFAKYLIDNS